MIENQLEIVMKRMNKVVVALGFALISALVATSASAASQCKVATITQTGAFPALENPVTGTSQYLVELDCADDTVWTGARQFMLTADLGEGGYATFLTAYALNQTVNVTVEGLAFRSLLSRVYLGAPPAP